MILLLHGQGGTGKTEVVSLLRRLLCEVFSDGGELTVASSNSAARVIGGETVHSALKMSAQQPLSIDKLSNAKVDNEIIDRLSAVEAVFVEEVSMVPSALLGALSLRMCVASALGDASRVPFPVPTFLKFALQLSGSAHCETAMLGWSQVRQNQKTKTTQRLRNIK